MAEQEKVRYLNIGEYLTEVGVLPPSLIAMDLGNGGVLLVPEGDGLRPPTMEEVQAIAALVNSVTAGGEGVTTDAD